MLACLGVLVFLISTCLPIAALASEGGGNATTDKPKIQSSIIPSEDGTITVPVDLEVTLTAPETVAGITNPKYAWQFSVNGTTYEPVKVTSLGAGDIREYKFMTTKEMASSTYYFRCQLTSQAPADASRAETEPIVVDTEALQVKVFEPTVKMTYDGKEDKGPIVLPSNQSFALRAAPFCAETLKPSGQITYQWQSSADEKGPFTAISSSGTIPTEFLGTAPDAQGSIKTVYYRYVASFTPTGSPEKKDVESNVIAISGVHAENGIYFVRPDTAPPPQSVAPGNPVHLEAEAKTTDNTSAISSYEWQYVQVSSSTAAPDDTSWQALSGSDSTSITTSNLEPGYYCFRCKATAGTGDAAKSAFSPVFRVNVEATALQGYTLTVDGVAKQMPANYTVSEPAGATVALTVALNNVAKSTTYQWQYQKGGSGWFNMDANSDAVGIQSPTLTVPVSETTNGLQYRCLVTSEYGTVGNGINDPWITLQMQSAGSAVAGIVPVAQITSNIGNTLPDISASVGMLVTFTAANASQPAIPQQYLVYQWEQASTANGAFTPIPEATKAQYTVEAKDGDPITYYRCRIGNTASSGTLENTSNSIRLQVKAADGSVYFTAPAQEETMQVHPEDIVSLNAEARTDNGDPVSYQWQFARVTHEDTPYDTIQPTAWTNVTDATKPSLTTEPLGSGFFFYRCAATNTKDNTKKALSPPYRVNVIPLSPIPDVVPGERIDESGGIYSLRIGTKIGDSLTLSVQATVESGDPLTYQWMLLKRATLNPVALGEGTSNTLVLRNIPEEYNGARIYCVVTNANKPTAKANSVRWILSVWSSAAVPQITLQPSNVTATLNPADPAAFSATISLTATGSTSASLEKFSEDRWQTVANSNQKPQNISDKNGTSSDQPSSQKYNWTVEAPSDLQSWDPSGQYRVAVMNEDAKVDMDPPLSEQEKAALLPPTAYSNPFTVGITILGRPVIVSEPTDQTAKVGDRATFTVSATVTPASNQLAYRWQISTDGGENWTNCLSTDGTSSGSTFTTTALTEAMQQANPAYQYRCVISNIATGQYISSRACTLTVKPGDVTPPPPTTDEGEILVTEGSDLTIAEGEVEGIVATKQGTPAELFMQGLQASEGFHLLLVDKDGKPVDPSDPIGTGMVVQLVSDLDPDDILESLVVIVEADVLGSGRVNIAQMTTMAKDLTEVKPLTGPYLKAGDFNNTGGIDIADLVSEARILNSTNL